MPAAAALDSEKPNGPRSRKGARTRARMLAAAKEIFEEYGFLDARISDIAERAGLSHGSFYHYFESKEEIFREVAEEVEERLSAPLGNVILDPASNATPAERIRVGMRLFLEGYRSEARIMGVIEQVSRYDEPVRTVRSRRHHQNLELMAESIRRMQRRGLVDPALDPAIATTALGAMTNRFPEAWFVEGALDCTFEEGVDQVTRVFLNGLGLKDEPERPRRRRPPAGA